MNRQRPRVALHWWVVALVVAAMSAPLPVWAAEASVMTIDTLKSRIDDPDMVILDVRTGRDWDSSGYLIKGAQRVSPSGAKKWGAQLDKSKTIVLYCA